MDDDAARRVTIETDDAPSYSLCGDPSRLERVVANLLTNAVKYSPESVPVDLRITRNDSEVASTSRA
jgi:signal transduction histidine kinase